MKTVTVDGKEIGDGNPVYIVAEVGTTHRGRIDTALSLIIAAKEAGADAIKFQLINPDYFMSDRDVEFTYTNIHGHQITENMYDMFKKLEFAPDQWRQIKEVCESNGITFYLSVDHIPGIELCEELEIPMYKIGSWDVTNIPLIDAVGKMAKPVQLDTGPGSLEDLARAVNVLHDGCTLDRPILMYCTHAKTMANCNLRTLQFLKHNFDCPVGYSSDFAFHDLDLVALGMGANVLEKRLRPRNDNNPTGLPQELVQGHHDRDSLDPEEFKNYIALIREVEKGLGRVGVYPSLEDLSGAVHYCTSIHTSPGKELSNLVIQDGTPIIHRNHLDCRRPGIGIPPYMMDQMIGKIAARDIPGMKLLEWDDVVGGENGKIPDVPHSINDRVHTEIVQLEKGLD